MPLNPNQHRAVGLLAMGLSTSIVASDLGICRQTLCRWKQMPEFQEALDREVGEIMAGLNTQVQSTARNLIEGGLEATQHLRYVMVKHGVKDQDRRICAAQLLHHAQRFYDMLGFNAKLATPSKLQHEALANLPHDPETEAGTTVDPTSPPEKNFSDVETLNEVDAEAKRKAPHPRPAEPALAGQP